MFADEHRNKLRHAQVNNPHYSLRAMARKIGVSPSGLSEFLNCKRNFSPQKTLQIAGLLGIEFSDSALQSCGESAHNGKKRKNVSPEEFSVVSQWQHFALLYLVGTKGFRMNFPWMARRLGLSVQTVEKTFANLLQVGLLQKIGSELVVNEKWTTTSNDELSLAIQNNHRQGLELAELALSTQNLDEREFQNLTLAFNKKDMAAAKKRIRDFIEKFDRDFGGDPAAQDVYRLNLQFLSLTKN